MHILNSVTPLNIPDCFMGHISATIELNSYQQLGFLTTPDATTSLHALHLKVTPPPNSKLVKTIFIHKIRHFISNSSLDRILKEINENNMNLLALEAAVIPSANH